MSRPKSPQPADHKASPLPQEAPAGASTQELVNAIKSAQANLPEGAPSAIKTPIAYRLLQDAKFVQNGVHHLKAGKVFSLAGYPPEELIAQGLQIEPLYATS